MLRVIVMRWELNTAATAVSPEMKTYERMMTSPAEYHVQDDDDAACTF